MQNITANTIIFSPRTIANGQGCWIGFARDIEDFEEGMSIDQVESLLDDPNAQVIEGLTVYSTRDEAIEQEIIAPIESGHESAEDFNIDAIADEVVRYIGEGTYLGFIVFPFPELHKSREVAFWSIVAEYDETDA